ncbi:Hypothetical_protein [Hexamita inflata]|uniref:Hypothetical_protein n=1 Tax=Hexamita inflata TaxID=28002 RepID=A0AA86PX38_9EUKA|nr:Hypothetical protein HINF_LOCUS35509 [Hexamita inflata]
MATVGTICKEGSECKSKACYVVQSAPYEKRCAITILNCSQTQMAVFVSTSSLTCKKKGGQACMSLTDTSCTYGCYQMQFRISFRCASELLQCNPIQEIGIYNKFGQLRCLQTAFHLCSAKNECMYDCAFDLLTDIQQCTPSLYYCADNNYAVCLIGQTQYGCRKKDGIQCTNDNECIKKCYLATRTINSMNLKCSSRLIDCSNMPGTTIAVNLNNIAICALNDGQKCTIQGISLECLNERCMQIEHNQNILKCITYQSVDNCDLCKTTQVCVADVNNAGICRQANGQTNCDSNSCANICLISRYNQMICTIPCEPSCNNPCLSEITGLKPICSKLPGERCDITIQGQCEFECLEIDGFLTSF